ncbi:MAG: hypothetical protein EOP04_11925, partial [Proteobacteria bacterium]
MLKRPLRLFSFSVLAFISIYSPISQAQEVELAPIEVDARRLEQDWDQGAWIDSSTISATQSRDVGNLLRQKSGLDYRANYSGLTGFSIRGSQSEHVLVLIDGVRVNDPSSPNRAFDFSRLNPALIESIEVIKGPASVAYGSDALGGVVLIRTKGRLADSSEIDLQAGSYKTVRASASSARTYSPQFTLMSQVSFERDSGPSQAKVTNGEEDSFSNLNAGLGLHGQSATAHTFYELSASVNRNKQELDDDSFTDDLAQKQAEKADKEIAAGHYKGVLHGIPFGAKDLLSAKNYKTTFGAAPYKEQQFEVDATVLKKLEDAGAVLIAKLSLGELAMDDTWFGGRTNNPWDLSRGSGGSSAGPGAAVAAGCMPFAIGSETWGSIVEPSNNCGLTGLRPSFGRVSKFGAMALSWSMDKLGPMTHCAEDCAIVFNAIYGTDPQDLSTISAPFKYDGNVKSLKGWKIGYLKTDFASNYPNHHNDSLSLVKMKELGATLIPIELPKLPFNSMNFILDAEAGAAFQELI